MLHPITFIKSRDFRPAPFRRQPTARFFPAGKRPKETAVSEFKKKDLKDKK
jgi:hypothetical protein